MLNRVPISTFTDSEGRLCIRWRAGDREWIETFDVVERRLAQPMREAA